VQNDELKEMLDQGFEPVIAEMTTYFPSVPHGVAVRTEKISSAADVAVVNGNVAELRIKHIALADDRRGDTDLSQSSDARLHTIDFTAKLSANS
jgi:hypothetical protein